MAYTRHNWECGEDITDILLNNIEEGVEEALQGGGCDCGYSCTETRESLIEESVTTEAGEEVSFAIGRFSTDPFWKDDDEYFPDMIAVTFNGTEYICPLEINSYGFKYYGATLTYDEETEAPIVDWSEYPFNITSELWTQTAGTYSVEIEAVNESIETSECFEKATSKVSNESLFNKFVKIGVTSQNGIDIVQYEDENGEWKSLTPRILSEVIFAKGKLPIIYYYYEAGTASFIINLSAYKENGRYKLNIPNYSNIIYFSDSEDGGYYYAQ